MRHATLPIKHRQFVVPVRANGNNSSGSSKKITQSQFTDKAWQAIVSAPEVAKEYSQQIVETEHLFKALLEQPNGLAR